MLISVDPTAWYRSASCFGNDVGGGIRNAESALAAALAGSEKIAGSDPSGAAWAAEYDRVAGATAQTINDLTAASLTVASLLRQTGVNHASADADSNPLGARLLQPLETWDAGFGSCVAVPSVEGGFLPAPDGWEMVTQVAAIIWPDGDGGKLRSVAEAWRTTASSLEAAWPSVSSALTALDGQDSPEVEQARGVCITVGDAITDTAGQCRALADSADAMAAHIEEAQAKLREQIAIMLAETALIEVAAVAAGAVTVGVGFAAGTGLAVLNATKFTARLTSIMTKFAEGARAALASMAWRSLDATTDSLHVIKNMAPTAAATVGVAGATKSLSALADRLAKSPWPMGPSPRGFNIEARLGGNLPASFPTIDRFNDRTGVATSIKSINLDAKTYQNPSRLEKLMTGYIDKVSGFNGANWGGRVIDEFDITARQLHVAIPRTASPEQMAVFDTMESYAKRNGVDLIVEVIR
jgi:hypothetical protein